MVEELNKGKIKVLGEDEMADKEEIAQAEAMLGMNDNMQLAEEDGGSEDTETEE